MSEENKAIARKFLRMFELGDLSMADEIIAADYHSHNSPNPNMGSEGVKSSITTFKNAFPDAKVKVEFLVAEGDKVVSRHTWSVTHQGEYMGVPATGKQANLNVMVAFGISHGKIREAWVIADVMGIMQQLGVVLSPGG